MERETKMLSVRPDVRIQTNPQRAKPPHQNPQHMPQPQLPPTKQTEQASCRDEVLRSLLQTVHQLTLKVEQLSTNADGNNQRQYEVKSSSSDYNNRPTTPRVFVCHRCGQEGHIARGCQNPSLNYQGPRLQGKPFEAKSNNAQ